MHRKRNALFALVGATCALTLATALPTLTRPQMPPQPTEHHKMIVQGAGDYEGTMTTFMMGENTVPAQETITALGDFWAHASFGCEFMGMPYSGMGDMGYDTAKGKFIGTWVDSMNTHLTVMEGDYDEATRTLTMHWEGPDMAGNVVPHHSKKVIAEDGNSYSMTFFMGEGDAAVKQMRIDMARVEAAEPVEAGAGR